MWTRVKSELSDTGLLPMQRCDVRGVHGWPDVVWQDPHHRGRAGWLELKHLETGAGRARGKKIGLRPDQALWLSRWVRFGGTAGVLLYVSEPRTWGYLPAEDSSLWRTLAVGPEAWNKLEWLPRLADLVPRLCRTGS